MFIHYLGKSLFAFVVLFCATIAFADVYKWVDEHGETHYSQLPPANQPADIIKAPPPPAIDPSKAQEKIDQLIMEQAEDARAREEKQQQLKQNAAQEATRKENCKKAKHNLQQYQDNPGRRVMDAEGNVTRIKEEDRQQKIKDFQKSVNEFCQ